MTLRTWLERYQLQTPAAILYETYRPLGWFAGELLQAFAPLLPVADEPLARLGRQLGDPEEQERLSRDVFGEGP